MIAISPHEACGLLDPNSGSSLASERQQHCARLSFARPPPLSRPLLKHPRQSQVHYLGVPCREVALKIGAAVAHEATQGGGASIDGQFREGLRGVTSKAAKLEIIEDHLQRLQYDPFKSAGAVT